MRTRRSVIIAESSDDELMDESSDSDNDNIFQDEEEEEENSNQIVLEPPTSFEHIPIIKLDKDYFMTAIYIKKFLHQSDYDLVKAFKEFGQEKDRKVLHGRDMAKLVHLSQHHYLSSDLEIKPNIKGVVLFRMEWIIEMFNREILSSESFVENVNIIDFIIVFDMERNCVNFKDEVIETLLESQKKQQEDKIKEEEDAAQPSIIEEETFHTCPIRTEGIEKFQDFLKLHISHTTSDRCVIMPFDY
ncbi:predicted protein [Naegleria gruberi]|uniref:Predicted protein n=1 Tax=Naegleria gruberi TaxID=5762 RepID=D2V2P5_NAEGR|nr:uncharacterized protein NAEGRDRAFT_46213 [Naegleria gruberi]EFC48930.1 predicted protein [Naegleria gruberi]|eukprot:XP_002681674.1 predicted protein [Naegleria gruberi strain NEG-M]